MNEGKLPFLIAITATLLFPCWIECLPSQRNHPSPMHLGCEVNGWRGADIPVSAPIRKNYEPLDVTLLWRRYTKAAQLPVECVIQQASNYEQLHDVFACLDYAGAAPKRLGVIEIAGLTAPLYATLFEYCLHNQHYYALFAYQWAAGAVNYPPANMFDKARLALVGRVPCRLAEINTPMTGNRQSAIARLKEFAAIVCAQPLSSADQSHEQLRNETAQQSGLTQTKQPAHLVDEKHTVDGQTALAPTLPFVQGCITGVLESKTFPAIGKLGGATDFILVQPETSRDLMHRNSPYTVALLGGTVLASVRRPSQTGVLTTDLADVAFGSNSDAFITLDTSSDDLVRVRTVAGLAPGVKVRVKKGPLAGKILIVEPGNELVISDHKLTRNDLRPADGILRRWSHLVEGGYAAVAEYFVEGALQQSTLVSDMQQRQQSDPKAKRILSDMSRMAFVLNQENGMQGYQH